MAATYLDDPGRYWIDMSSADFVAENAPWTAQWCAALISNQIYLKRLMYGDGTYDDNVPHAHRGDDDGHAEPHCAHNILLTPTPDSDAFDTNRWRRVGFGDFDLRDVAQGGVEGDELAQLIGHDKDKDGQHMLGSGVPMVGSIFVRTRGVPTRGALMFGIAGAKGTFLGNELEGVSVGEFIEGQAALEHWTDHNTTNEWYRFWSVFENAGRGGGGRAFKVKVVASFDVAIEVTGMSLTLGRRLYPWMIGPLEYKDSTHSRSNAGWSNMPGLGSFTHDPPLFEWSTAMSGAIELKAI